MFKTENINNDHRAIREAMALCDPHLKAIAIQSKLSIGPMFADRPLTYDQQLWILGYLNEIEKHTEQITISEPLTESPQKDDNSKLRHLTAQGLPALIAKLGTRDDIEIGAVRVTTETRIELEVEEWLPVGQKTLEDLTGELNGWLWKVVSWDDFGDETNNKSSNWYAEIMSASGDGFISDDCNSLEEAKATALLFCEIHCLGEFESEKADYGFRPLGTS